MSVVACEMFMFSVWLNTNQLRVMKTFRSPSPPPRAGERGCALPILTVTVFKAERVRRYETWATSPPKQ